MSNSTGRAGVACALLAMAACSEAPPPAGEAADTASASAVTTARIVAAGSEPENWLSHGRTYDEQRFSPLDAINRDNVGDLGLAWYFDIPTERGIEATPIVIDGTMYVTGSWSIVYALDAATGEELWRYDPEVPKAWAQYACCDVVNRGVAAWGENVYVGTLDGWLVALDRESGKVRWRVDTIDRQPPYTITGAPRVVDGLVIIGNGGADLGVRGYVSAYDAVDGALVWRFYTVPGNPADGFESEALEEAAATWTGEWWRYGGGGTVWDSMAYDPDSRMLYIGVGNGSPWNRRIRSPEGGDNLYLSSIVALDVDTGEYVWHYQTTPGDTWDFTATQHIILADLEIDGEIRKVLMQAPKNGFFYVIDRTDGELISAAPYVTVTWASGIDPATGRPIETPNARYADGPVLMMPAGLGGHNWHPMAFDPGRGLVYLPAQDIPAVYAEAPEFEFTKGVWNTGIDFERLETPSDPAVVDQILKLVAGRLVAWDPVAQEEVWRHRHAGPWNGGVLATAGDLVFQGSLVGEFAAYDADTGERLWAFPAQTGIAAAPVAYRAADTDFIAVAAGWGTIFSLLGGELTASLGLENRSRVLAFSRGGEAKLPEPEPAPPAPAPAPFPSPPPSDADEATLALGKALYYQRCSVCHGLDVASGGVLPDLRRMSPEMHDAWDAIVLGGSLAPNGMPAFAGIIDKAASDAIQAFVIERASEARAAQEAAAR